MGKGGAKRGEKNKNQKQNQDNKNTKALITAFQVSN